MYIQINSYLRIPFSDLLNENLLEGPKESVYFAIAHVILKIKLRIQPRFLDNLLDGAHLAGGLAPWLVRNLVWVSLSQFSSFGQRTEHISLSKTLLASG